jgi:hypothetical protein
VGPDPRDDCSRGLRLGGTQNRRTVLSILEAAKLQAQAPACPFCVSSWRERAPAKLHYGEVPEGGPLGALLLCLSWELADGRLWTDEFCCCMA